MDGGLDIELQVRNGSLLLRYLKKGDTVRKEEHKLSDIKSISCAEARFTLSPEPNSLFIIRFTDSEESFDLLHFSGRPLKIGRENTDKLLRFFEEQGIETDRS